MFTARTPVLSAIVLPPARRIDEPPENEESAEGAAAAPVAPVKVLLPLPLRGVLDYRRPETGPAPVPGEFVRVGLGSRRLAGVVWDDGSEGAVPAERLKAVIEILPTPALRPELRSFIDRVAAYTLAPAGAVLRMAMSVEAALLPPPPRRVCEMTPAGLAALDGGKAVKLTAARSRVLEALRDCGAASATEIARRAGCGLAVMRGLIAAGLVAEKRVPGTPPAASSAGWRHDAAMLSPDQLLAARRLLERTGAAGFSVTVLDGVTGSGKTETYFAAIAAALDAGRQVLVLLPEIALGAQWLDRFRRRFGAEPAQWHSDITQAARRDTWREVASGRARLVVGARSALFLPFADLGLIIVDEEHDPSYKQDDGVAYQARDMAVLRASVAGIPIVLVSATPSLETVVNIARGRYAAVHLPRRHADAALPHIQLVDMRRERVASGRFLVSAAARCGDADPGRRRAGAIFSQPPRLCTSDIVPGVRPSHAVPELHRLAGRAPLHRAAAMPSLRPLGDGAGTLPGMPRQWQPCAVRPRGRADQGGSRGAISGGPDRADGQRSAVGAARRLRAGRGNRGASP